MLRENVALAVTAKSAPTLQLPVVDPDVNAPVDAEFAPIAVPSIAPPSILTALAACVAIVPNPKLVLAVAAFAKSFKLFALNA